MYDSGTDDLTDILDGFWNHGEISVNNKEEQSVLEFTPIGPCADFITDRSPAIALTGPAGTGKTRTILEKIYRLAMKYPGTNIAICREMRVDLNKSALKTWEEEVVPPGHLVLRGASRPSRSTYKFPNGSSISIFGLQQSKAKESEGGGAAKLTSTFWHLIYIVEANETTYEKFLTAKSRCREFKGSIPFRQVVMDFNPVLSTHWLYRAEQEGLLKIVKTYHHDNPLWFNPDDPSGGVIHPRTGKPGTWTPAGQEYVVENLGSLTGNLRKRFFLGLPMAPEGSIYPDFSDDHIQPSLLMELSSRISGEPLPGHPRYHSGVPDEDRITAELAYLILKNEYDLVVGCDWGVGHAMVHHLWAFRKDDKRRPARLLCEFYRSGVITSDSATEFINFLGWEYELKENENGAFSSRHLTIDNDLGFVVPIFDIETGEQLCVCVTDHSLESRELWRRATGIEPERAVKAVNDGIETTKGRIKEFLITFDDIEVIGGADPKLAEKGKPTRTVEEISNYRWQKATMNFSNQKPIKVNDDGCDTMKYVMAYADSVEGEELDVNSLVVTSDVQTLVSYTGTMKPDPNTKAIIQTIAYLDKDGGNLNEGRLFCFDSYDDNGIYL